MADAASTPSSRSGRLPRVRSIGRGYGQDLSIRTDGGASDVVAGEVERDEAVISSPGASDLDVRGMLAPEQESARGFTARQEQSLQGLLGDGAIPDLIDGVNANALHLPNGAIVIQLTGGRTLEVLPDGQMVHDGAVHAAGALDGETIAAQIAPRDDASMSVDPAAAAWRGIEAYDFTPEQAEMLGLLMEPPVTPGSPDFEVAVARYAEQMAAHCLGRGGSVLIDLNPTGSALSPGDRLQESLAITPDGQVSYGENTWTIQDVRDGGMTPGTEIFRMRAYQTGSVGLDAPDASTMGLEPDVEPGLDGTPAPDDAFADAVYFTPEGRVSTVIIEALGDETLLNELEAITGIPADEIQYVRLEDDGAYVVVPGDVPLSPEEAQLMARRVLETITPDAFARMQREAMARPGEREIRAGDQEYDPTGDPPWLVGIHAAIDGVEDARGPSLGLDRD